MAKADDEVLAMLPWMVRDWLSSRARAVLKHEGRSVYRELLDHAWLSPGCVLPDNDAMLAALADLTLDHWKELRPVLLSLDCFEVRAEGLLNAKLHALWVKAKKLRAEKRRAGRKGGQVSGKVRRSATKQTFVSASSKREAEPKPPSPSPTPSPENGQRTSAPDGAPRSGWNAEACSDWEARFKAKPSTSVGIRISAQLKALVDAHTWPTVRAAWRRHLASEGKHASPESFAARYAVWAPAPRPAPVPENAADEPLLNRARELADEFWRWFLEHGGDEMAGQAFQRWLAEKGIESRSPVSAAIAQHWRDRANRHHEAKRRAG